MPVMEEAAQPRKAGSLHGLPDSLPGLDMGGVFSRCKITIPPVRREVLCLCFVSTWYSTDQRHGSLGINDEVEIKAIIVDMSLVMDVLDAVGEATKAALDPFFTVCIVCGTKAQFLTRCNQYTTDTFVPFFRNIVRRTTPKSNHSASRRISLLPMQFSAVDKGFRSAWRWFSPFVAMHSFTCRATSAHFFFSNFCATRGFFLPVRDRGAVI